MTWLFLGASFKTLFDEISTGKVSQSGNDVGIRDVMKGEGVFVKATTDNKPLADLVALEKMSNHLTWGKEMVLSDGRSRVPSWFKESDGGRHHVNSR